MKPSEEKPRWLDHRRNVDKLVYALWVACGLLVLAELFYEKHPHFGFDGWFAFYAVFGFAAYCAIVLSAKQLRRLIKRDEDYYGDD
jgi:hypothetical protein